MYRLVDLAHPTHVIATHPITTHHHMQAHVVLHMFMHPQSPLIYISISIWYGTPVFWAQPTTYMYDHWHSQTPQLDL